jgi:hypothetical protein
MEAPAGWAVELASFFGYSGNLVAGMGQEAKELLE